MTQFLTLIYKGLNPNVHISIYRISAAENIVIHLLYYVVNISDWIYMMMMMIKTYEILSETYKNLF